MNDFYLDFGGFMNRNNFFPLFINLKNKNILIIGAGNIAYRKFCSLCQCEANIEIITKEVKEKKFDSFFSKNNFFKITKGDFTLDFLKEQCLKNFLVILATDDFLLNDELSKYCDKQNILVNNVSSKTNMNCRFPSILKKGDCTLAISASGNPKKSKALKNKLLSIDL